MQLFPLLFRPVSGIIRTMKFVENTHWHDYLGGPMSKFYHETWLPFVFNKKRILFLTIASYIALC